MTSREMVTKCRDKRPREGLCKLDRSTSTAHKGWSMARGCRAGFTKVGRNIVQRSSNRRFQRVAKR
jgi:hypothetical protein